MARKSADIARLIDRDLQRLGSQAALAKEMGISQGYLNGVIHGKWGAGPKILRHYGLVAKRVYLPEEVA